MWSFTLNKMWIILSNAYLKWFSSEFFEVQIAQLKVTQQLISLRRNRVYSLGFNIPYRLLVFPFGRTAALVRYNVTYQVEVDGVQDEEGGHEVAEDDDEEAEDQGVEAALAPAVDGRTPATLHPTHRTTRLQSAQSR